MSSTARYAPAPAPTAHALSRPHAGSDTLLADDGSDSESVAESSCPWPLPCRPTACGGDEEEEDDDGCSSCVEGNELGYYYQEGDEEEEEEVSTARFWWQKRLAVAGGQRQELRREEVEDPERVAARQAEDRKFWEDCLGTGYP